MTSSTIDGVAAARHLESGPVAPLSADEGPLRVGQRFGSRYHILRLLGAGGMGAVYQAWDDELSVSVAIKVIRPEVIADPKTAAAVGKRFKRELLLARKVTHKNVVRIHDLGEIDGIKYISMAYVDGVDLSTMLRGAGKLPPARALRIGRSVLSGLVEAHSKGIVHRDLKPGNIMIGAAGEAVIMDFGIARSTDVPDNRRLPDAATIVGEPVEASADTTALGAVVGTLRYMAPEQARAARVDQRADVYSFGLIMYDMLVGKPRAQTAEDALGELLERMQHAPTRVKAIVPEVPAALDDIVSRCLEPDVAKRFQTSRELSDALDRLDDEGAPKNISRSVWMRLFAIVAVLGLALLGGRRLFSHAPAAPLEHQPVSVLIADFRNLTSDPAFDGTLESVVGFALESAMFIRAFDRAGIREQLGVLPPEKLDERAGQELAAKHGLGVILAGSIVPQGGGYAVSVRATDVATGTVIANATEKVSRKDRVLDATTKIARIVREALGDNHSDQAERRATDNLSATSVEAMHEWAAGTLALSDSKLDEARQHFAAAVERDPRFGLGWAGIAMAEFNLDRMQDAKNDLEQALSLVDGMPLRERYRTRGRFRMLTGDYRQCVQEYSELLKRSAIDTSARNDLALCLTRLGQVRRAVEEMQEVTKVAPNHARYRENLALYRDYDGDFEAAERDARAVHEPSAVALLGLAFSEVGQSHLSQAAETYAAIQKTGARGASYAASGLGDLAMYEGRFSDAAKIFEAAAEKDLAEKDPDRAAAKLASLGQARLERQQRRLAIAAAENALANSHLVKIRFLAARIFVEAGEAAKAQKLADGLRSEPEPSAQAFAKIVEGEAALKNEDPRAAIKALIEANALADTWIGRLALGRAFLAAGAFTQADSEFDLCIRRRGEALSLFLDEEPTYAYLPPAYYYQGRAREGLKTAGFADWYKAYVDIRGKSTEDRLLPDARRRGGDR